MTPPPRGALSLPDLVADAFGLVVRNWSRFLVLSAPGALLSAGAYALRYVLVTSLDAKNSDGSTALSTGDTLAFVGWTMAVLLAAFISEALIVPGAFDAYLGRRPQVGHAFGVFVRIAIPLVIGWLLISGSLLVLFGLVLPAPFAVFLAVRWSFYVQELVREPSSTIAAMKRSSAVAKGFWWRTALIHIAILLLGSLPGVLAQVAFRDVNIGAINVAVAGITVWIAGPFSAMARTLLYADIKLRKGERVQNRVATES